MPQYLVQIRVNVPTLGERLVTTPPLVANDIPDAIIQALATVILEVLKVEKVGP